MLDETFDLLDIPAGDIAADEGDRFDAVAIALDEVVIDAKILEDEAHPEPSLADAPFFIEFDETPRLDPERSSLAWELPPAIKQWAMRRGAPLASLGFHLLPAITIILLPLLVIEPAPPIPVQLVFEQPPPPPDPPEPKPETPPTPQKMEVGRLSSVDMGAIKKQDNLGRAADAVKPPADGPQQAEPSENQAKTPPPPVPSPKPAPPKEHQSALRSPTPSGARARHEETPHEAAHTARYAGQAATKDEYLVHLVALTRQHIDLLPMSFLGDRHGETVISVVVYENGQIGPLGVVHSSGYPDIDRRIEQMVAAVGRFPPLPQWYQGNAVQLQLTLKFPEALEMR